MENKQMIQSGEQTPRVAEPTRNSVQWENRPAEGAWCPAGISQLYPELGKLRYKDDAAFVEDVREWRILAATKRGKMHAHRGEHREDAIGFRSEKHFTLLCVADGAGSSEFSRLGSRETVLTVMDFVYNNLRRFGPGPSASDVQKQLASVVSGGVLAACERINEIAKRTQTPSKEFRCTLLSLLHYHEKERKAIVVNQIGDGAVCLLDRRCTVRRIGTSDSGEFSGEVSCFVPDDCAREKAAQIHVEQNVEDIEALLLCSDGVEDPFYPMEANAVEVFKQLYCGVGDPLPDFVQEKQGPIVREKRPEEALLRWLGFQKRGENDDRSMLLMHRHPVRPLWGGGDGIP